MSEIEKCPKCGAKVTKYGDGFWLYECGYHSKYPTMSVTRTCLERQLSQATERLSASAAREERLREALAGLVQFYQRDDEGPTDAFERVGDAFKRETGYLRPGKDCVVHSHDERSRAFSEWCDAKIAAARAALAEGKENA